MEWNKRRAGGLAIVCGLLGTACSDGSTGTVGKTAVTAPLTYFSGTDFFEPGETLDACFLAEDLDVQKGWIKAAIYRTWEFVADIKVNWLSSCPGSGALVRIGIAERDEPEESQTGWTPDVGVDDLRDERALNNADQNSLWYEKPSIKLYLQPTPTNQGRVEYLGVHEFGHVLGFADETNCSEIEEIPLTGDDFDSIMHYCGSHGNSAGWITGLDAVGVQSVYGMSGRFVAAAISVL